MEAKGYDANLSDTKQPSVLLEDVMMAEPSSLSGLGNNSSEMGDNFDSFLHTLGDQGESLLTEETVNKITEILTPEQRMILEAEAAGTLIKNGVKTPGLSREGIQPCFQMNEHAQSRNHLELRPSHGGQTENGWTVSSTKPSVENKQTMQHASVSKKPEASEKRTIIQEGLQKIKQQLGEGGGKLLCAEADPGPAVVTEFIGDQGSIGFGADLDDISKYSMDSQENSVEKSKESDPPVRRSGRKTVRLFEIVPPKRGRKKEAESDDTSNSVKSGSTTPKDSKGTQGKENQKEGAANEEKELPRKSLRRQKAESSDEKSDEKQDTNQVKKTGPGRPRKRKIFTKEEKDEKPMTGRKSSEKSKREAKSDDDEKKGKKNDSKTEKRQPGRPRGRPPKRKTDDEGEKDASKKNEKRRSHKKAKTDDKSEEEKETDGDESELSDSEPDDGELSDNGSEFDPDEDPDRPWCICRKPHGNRFMICCDTCEDWYHGDCVGVTQADGKELEKKSEEWMCPKCRKKLYALAKDVKEKERQERIKMREKSEVTSDETSTVQMRQKLLKALEKELSAEKASKILNRTDLTDSELEGDEEEEEETKVEEQSPVVDDIKEKMKKRTKKKMSKEERELKEAKHREKELEWKKQLKEMKARAQKAEQIARRKGSIENQMTFEKVGAQKIAKPKEGGADVKQEPAEKKAEITKKEVKVRFLDSIPDRRRSDSSLKDIDKKSPANGGRRISTDDAKEAKTDDVPKKQVRITPTPKTVKPVATVLKYCIVCKKLAMKNAVYCSKECMKSYTKESLRLIAEDKQKRLGPKSSEVKSPVPKDATKGMTSSPAASTTNDDDKDERIAVVERSTKKVIAGVMAPTKANIYKWVEEHPTFEVFRPAHSKPEGFKTSSFYGSRSIEKIQIHAATTSNSTLKEKKDLMEVVRNNVKKSLKETIMTRCRDVEMEVDAEELTKTCNLIEEEIVKMYGDTGQKYKTKYRSLIFNLKDPKNRSLYKQVVLGELTPAKLVHMTPEQLASAELAKWREREAKHNLELIKKREEEEAYALKHAVKKTHKGEIEVEQEGEEDMKNLQTHIEQAEEQKDHVPEEGDSVLPVDDTTEQHNSHLFDLNCKICTGKQQPVGEKQPILPHVSTSVIQAIPESSAASPTGSPEEMDFRQSSPDLIDSMNRSPIHIPLPSKERDDPVWKGFVLMPSVAKFAANAYRISGPCDHLSRLVPDTVNICGRITHEQVWDYLYQLKSTTHKTIEVLRFEMAAEDEKKDYVTLYSYFYTRKRIGVIGNCHSGVKDMYIVPIASHDPIPPELKPFDGPGMPDPRPHMLIGIIVRTKPVVPAKRAKPSTPEHSHSKAKKKHKHKKEEKKKYEDIVFGKQRAGINLEGTPSDSGASYTPTYTPDVMSPPSQVPSSSAASQKNDENKILEEKLARQKKELLKLQAEIRAQINENKALGIQPPSQTLLESSTIGTPSDSVASSSSTSLSGLNFSNNATSTSSSYSSVPSSGGSSITASIPSETTADLPVQVYAPVRTSADAEKLPFIGDTDTTLTSAYPSNAGKASQASADAPVSTSLSQASIKGVATVTHAVASTATAPEDEPYDPEDELDTASEVGTKSEMNEDKVDGKGDKERSEVTGGDEPYDPEDDFVLDLIEDITLPTSLKKIEKPNLPFPLEMPKKPDSKMPELPPIKLPEKITDRRAVAMATANTPIDPRASPMNQVGSTLTPLGTPNTQSPSSKSLASPSSGGSYLTSPTGQKSWDTRQTSQTGVEKSDTAYQQSSKESGTRDQTKSGSDYWQSDQSQEQPYASYNQYQTTSGQQPGRSDGNYQGRYGETYSQQWQGGQSGHDSSWDNYNTTRKGDGRAWEGGDPNYGGSHYYGNRGYDNYDNSRYRRTQDYSNYDRYNRDEHRRSWEGYGDRDRGYYRGSSRDRGRGNKWK